MRTKIEELWSNLLNLGTARVKTVSLFREKEKMLVIILPHQLPGWRIEVTLSHTKQRTCQWLVNKAILRNLSKWDLEVLRIIGGQLPDAYYFLIKFIISDEFRKAGSTQRQQIIPIIQKHFLIPKVSKDYLCSFKPEIDICKVWTKKKSLKPKRFIGVGYNDHGHLSSLPSWKDQILYSDDTGSKEEPSFIYDSLLRAFRLDPKDWRFRYLP